MTVPLTKKGHTAVIQDGTTTRVTLYATDVVTITPTQIILNTGGHFTATTKQRMNQASREFNLGFQVYQQMFVWSVAIGNRVIPFTGNIAIIERG